MSEKTEMLKMINELYKLVADDKLNPPKMEMDSTNELKFSLVFDDISKIKGV